MPRHSTSPRSGDGITAQSTGNADSDGGLRVAEYACAALNRPLPTPHIRTGAPGGSQRHSALRPGSGVSTTGDGCAPPPPKPRRCPGQEGALGGGQALSVGRRRLPARREEPGEERGGEGRAHGAPVHGAYGRRRGWGGTHERIAVEWAIRGRWRRGRPPGNRAARGPYGGGGCWRAYAWRWPYAWRRAHADARVPMPVRPGAEPQALSSHSRRRPEDGRAAPPAFGREVPPGACSRRAARGPSYSTYVGLGAVRRVGAPPGRRAGGVCMASRGRRECVTTGPSPRCPCRRGCRGPAGGRSGGPGWRGPRCAAAARCRGRGPR